MLACTGRGLSSWFLTRYRVCGLSQLTPLMGELGAIHEDVKFDWAMAADLAAELRSTATVLEAQQHDRERLRGMAREHWEGRFGDEFDGRVGVCIGDAGRLASSLRAAADRLDEMARLSRKEQDRRVRAQEWEKAQADGGGGLLGAVPVVGDVIDSVGDFVFGEDELPPPPPVEPPTIPIEAPAVVGRMAGG
jgi:hypothetical protein